MGAIKEILHIDGVEEEKVLGLFDAYVKRIKRECNVNITVRGKSIRVAGEEDDVARAAGVIHKCIARVREGKEVTDAFLDALLREGSGKSAFFSSLDIYPRTKGQEQYLETIATHDIVFVTGPAGTGKTYLAVASAVNALLEYAVKKIVLVRPAVEAGEKLGFLPGDMQEKVNPYLSPVYDALYDMLGYDTTRTYMERGIIEVIPIAYMRGRTFHNSFIIMDEGQNTSRRQMLMFLTRMGVGSKVVVTGDVTQIDLPPGEPSGMLHALSVFAGVDEIGIVELKRADIVRHGLVKKIVRLYQLDTEG